MLRRDEQKLRDVGNQQTERRGEPNKLIRGEHNKLRRGEPTNSETWGTQQTERRGEPNKLRDVGNPTNWDVGSPTNWDVGSPTNSETWGTQETIKRGGWEGVCVCGWRDPRNSPYEGEPDPLMAPDYDSWCIPEITPSKKARASSTAWNSFIFNCCLSKRNRMLSLFYNCDIARCVDAK